MAATIMIAAKDIKSSATLEDFVSSIDSANETLPLLLAIAKNALEENLTQPFLIIDGYIREKFSGGVLQDLNELTTAFIIKNQGESVATELLQRINDQQKLQALVNRLVSETFKEDALTSKKEALTKTLSDIATMGHPALLKAFYLQQPVEAAFCVPLTYLSASDFIELLSEINQRAALGANDSSLFAKQNRLFYYSLRQFKHRQEKVETLAASDFSTAFIEYFIEQEKHFENSAAILKHILENLTISSQPRAFVDRLNQCLMECLNGASSTVAISLLKAHESCVSTPQTLRLVVNRLNQEPSNKALFLPYINSLDNVSLMNFISLEPHLDKPTLKSLFERLDEADLMTMMLLMQAQTDSTSTELIQCLYEHIAAFYKTVPRENLSAFLDASFDTLEPQGYRQLITKLFEQTKGHEAATQLVMTLISQLSTPDIKRHEKTLLPCVRAFTVELLATTKSESIAQKTTAMLSRLATKPHDFSEVLLKHYSRCVDASEFFNLCLHLQSTGSEQSLSLAIKVITQTPTLTKELLKSDFFDNDLISSVISGISNDLLIDMIIEGSLLKSPPFFNNLLTEVSKRLTAEYASEKFVSRVHKELFSNERIARSFLQSAECISELSALPENLFKYIPGVTYFSSSPTSLLENRIKALFSLASALIDNDTLKPLSIDLLIFYSDKPTEFISLLERLSTHSGQPDIISNLKKILFQTIAADGEHYDEKLLHQKIKTLCTSGKAKPLAYTEIAKSFADSDNFIPAAKQLEMVDLELASLNFSSWTTNALVNILQVSSASSVNWRHAADIIHRQFNNADDKKALFSGLVEKILSVDGAHSSLKKKAATFIAEHLSDTTVICELPTDAIKPLLSNLNLSEALDETPTLATLLNRLRKNTPDKYHQCANVIAKKCVDEDISCELFEHYLQSESFSSAKFLALLSTHLLADSSNKKELVPPLLTYIKETLSDIDKKIFLLLVFKNSPSLECLEKLLPLIVSLPLSAFLPIDETPSDKELVTAMIDAICNAGYLSSDSFGPQSLNLLHTTITTLCDKAPSFERTIAERPSLLAFIHSALASREQNIQEALYEFISQSNYNLLCELREKLVSQDLFYETIEKILKNEHYITNLDTQRYTILFNLLPSPYQKHLAIALLSVDPHDKALTPHIKLLAHALAPQELYSLFDTHSNKKLFASLALMNSDSFNQLGDIELSKLLNTINNAADIHDLLVESPPQSLTRLVKHLLLVLGKPTPSAWLDTLNLLPTDLILFCNAIQDDELIQSLLKEIEASRGAYLYSGLENHLKDAVKTQGLCSSLYHNSLLGRLIVQWLEEPDFFAQTSTSTLDDIAKAISISEIADIFHRQEQHLDLSQQVQSLMAPVPLSPCFQASTVTSRWFVYLPMINESYNRSQYFLSRMLSIVEGDSEEVISADTIAILCAIKDHIQKPVKHHSHKSETNPYYAHFIKLRELLETSRRSIASESNDFTAPLSEVITLWQQSLHTIKQQVDGKLLALKTSTLNLGSIFYPDSMLINIRNSDGEHRIDYLLGRNKTFWEQQIQDALHQSDVYYQNKLLGLQKVIESILSAYRDKKSITPKQRLFIRQALTSGHHLFTSQSLVEEASSLLTPDDLDGVFKLFQVKKKHERLVEQALQPLRHVNTHPGGPDYIVEFLIQLSQYSLDTLRQLYQASMLANASQLSSVLQMMLTVKESLPYDLQSAKGQAYLQSLVTPPEINYQEEEVLLHSDIDKVINSIYDDVSRYTLVYRSALSYSSRKAPFAQQILTSLSTYDHDILPGAHLASLLNSYLGAIKDGSLNIEAVEIALYNLFSSCDYTKQCQILQSLNHELSQNVLLSVISGLSSPLTARRERSAKLLDVYTSFCQRVDSQVDNTALQKIIRENLSQDDFSRYADKLGRMIVNLSDKDTRNDSTQDVNTATYDGIWIQRIITNPSLVAKLTAHEFHELIERYRLLSKFLKRDEYDSWEKYAPAAIKKLQLEYHKSKQRLTRESASLSEDETAAIKQELTALQKRIDNLEDKKRRLLEFKANDAIRELLKQLQDSIASSPWETHVAADATFNAYLKLELADYKADILSRTCNRLYQSLISHKGDLQRSLKKESSIFTRLIDKYIRHDNFVSDELLSSSIILTKGTKLYSQRGKLVCILGEGLSLNQKDISCNDKPITLSEKSLRAGTKLFTKDNIQVGIASESATLEPNNLFQAETSAKFLTYLSTDDISQLPNALPYMFQDILTKGALPSFYLQIFDKDSDCPPEKKLWIQHEMHRALIHCHDYALSPDDCKQLAAYHDDFFSLIEHSISESKKEQAIDLIKAWLANRQHILSFMTEGPQREKLYDYLTQLAVTKADLLSMSTHLFNHEYASQIRNILDSYAFALTDEDTSDDTDSNLIDLSHEVPASHLRDYQKIQVDLLTPKMIRQLTKNARLGLLLSPKTYMHLSDSGIKALTYDFKPQEKSQLFNHLLSHHSDGLFFDKILARLISLNTTLFFDCLTSPSLRTEIMTQCLTCNEVLLALSPIIERQQQSHTAIKTIKQYLYPDATDIIKHVDLTSFIYAANCYLEKYNTSVELKTILNYLINERLGDFIGRDNLKDSDLQTIVSLLGHEDFVASAQATPLSKGLYNRVIEEAACHKKLSVFYQANGKLNTRLATKTLKRSVTEEIYDNLSDKKRDSTWDKVKKALSVSAKFKARLPWIGDRPAESWAEFKEKSWIELQQLQGNIKAIDLFLVKHPGVCDTTALEKLINDYLLTFYQPSAETYLPKQGSLSCLHSTISLLENEFVSSSVKRAIFNAISKHPRLRDSTILQKISGYDFERLLGNHGARQEYQEIIELDKHRSHIADVKQPLLNRAIREARLEKSISEMTPGFFSPLVVWFKRAYHYGFNFFNFRINEPVYVKQAEIGVKVPETAPVTPSGTGLVLLASQGQSYTCDFLIQEVLAIENHLDEAHHDDIAQLLEHLTDKVFSYQTSIEDEIAFRKALNKMYDYAFSSQNYFTHGIGSHLSISSRNRKQLIELYRYQENHESDIKALLEQEKAHQSAVLGSDILDTKLSRACAKAGIDVSAPGSTELHLADSLDYAYH